MPAAYGIVREPELHMLCVRWGGWGFGGAFRPSATVELGANVLARYDGSALARGATLPLPDGSVLELRSARFLLASEVVVSRDGAPFARATSLGAGRVYTASGALAFVGAGGLLGLIGRLLHSSLLAAFYVGPPAPLLEPLLLVALGAWARLRGSLAAILIGVLVIVAGDARTLSSQLRATGRIDWTTVLIFLVFLGFILPGIGGARALAQSRPRS